MAYEISKCVICLHETTTSKTPLPSPTRTRESCSFFFFTRAASPVFRLSLAHTAKASNDTSILDEETANQIGREREKKKTSCVMIDIPASFYYSCDVCPDILVPETVASHFGWCSSLVICVSLPANHLAVRSIINLLVNHGMHSQWCGMSVGGSEADLRWLQCPTLTHPTLHSGHPDECPVLASPSGLQPHAWSFNILFYFFLA